MPICLSKEPWRQKVVVHKEEVYVHSLLIYSIVY